MRSLNRVELIGHLGADPETRYTPSGDAVSNLRLATNEAWTDRASGERRERSEWHRCVLWRQLAEIAERYLRKGSRVFVAGQLTTRQWQDQSGTERYTTEIQVRDLLMLDGAGSNARAEHTPAGVHPAYTAQQGGPAAAPPPRQPPPQTGHQSPPHQPQHPAHFQAQAPGPQSDFDDDIPF